MMNAANKPFKILFLNHAPNQSHMEDMAGIFEMGYMAPLIELGLAEVEQFWFKEWEANKDEPIDWELFQKCASYKPDVVICYAWWMYSEFERARGNTALITFYLIRKLLGIKVVAYLFDQYNKHFTETDILVKFCDLAYTHEHQKYFLGYTAHPEKHFKTFAPCSPKFFERDPLAPREIPISFVGGVKGYLGNEREEGIAALKAAGINIFQPGGRSKDQKKLSNQEYADIFKNSQICLNWSRHITGDWFQAKGRIFEVLSSGALLMCQQCEEVDDFITPNVHYVPFSSSNELVEKAKYYMKNHEARVAIATAGHNHLLKNYRADIEWNRTIEQISNTSFFNEEDAKQQLRINRTTNELRVAQYFHKNIPKYFPDISITELEEAARLIDPTIKESSKKNKKPRIIIPFYVESESQKKEIKEFTKMIFIGPLIESDLAETSVFWYGPSMGCTFEEMNIRLFEACKEFKPDYLLLINGWCHDNIELQTWRPRLSTFYLIRKILKTKLFALWTDQAFEAFKESDILTRLLDFSFTHEPRYVFENHSQFPEKYKVVPEPLSEILYGDPFQFRDIDVLFIGGTEGYQGERKKGLESIAKAGLPITILGGRVNTGGEDKKLSNQEYADALKRSKIVLNWSRSYSGAYFHAKGRAFETTLAGSLLISEECKPLNDYFRPNIDYVPFSSSEELVSKIRHYLMNPEDAVKIARSGHQRAVEKYNLLRLWENRIFQMENESYFNEREALNALKEYSSPIEIKVADALACHLEKYENITDIKLAHDIRAIVRDTPPFSFIQSTQSNFSNNDLASAFPTLETAARLLPNDSNIQLSFGTLAGDLGYREEAISALKLATDSEPDNPLAWKFLGIELYRLQKFDESASALNRSIQLNPTDTETKEILHSIGHAFNLITSYEGKELPQTERVLLLRYKYVPNSTLSQHGHEYYCVSRPFLQSGFGQLVEYYLDDMFIRDGAKPEALVFQLIQEFKPTVIIASSYAPRNPNHPSFQFFQAVRAELKIPFVCMWHDTCGHAPLYHNEAALNSNVDLHLLIDSNRFLEKFPQLNMLRRPPPIDPTLFWSNETSKDIDVSFVGSTTGYRSIRGEFLDYISANSKIEVLKAGGQAENPLTWQNYANILRRSKISLNFSHSIDEEHQLKARVIEALASDSLLIENENNETTSFFTPFEDYVTFSNKDDLIDKINYYLTHEDERRRISRNGYNKVLSQHTGFAYYKDVFDALKKVKI